MKQIVCEMCSSTDLIKHEGLFVCQSCGSKYSVEEAKKMMVEIAGTVKIDTKEKFEKSLLNARRAKNDDNAELARKFYEEVMTEDPSNWEAIFYTTYYKAMQCTIGEISASADSVTRCLSSVVSSIKNDSERASGSTAMNEISEKLIALSSMFYNSSNEQYKKMPFSLADMHTNNALNSAYMLLSFGDELIEQIGENDHTIPVILSSFDYGVNMIRNDSLASIHYNEFTLLYIEHIKRLNPSYTAPAKSGCYIATSVYGSYDCPQVWTLRRYRDDTLTNVWYGRLFIRLYYATSPTVVKLFGKKAWFNNFCKKRLDMFIENLKRV
jgi:uncharacterized Zn finger protein (UPF0148 family)